MWRVIKWISFFKIICGYRGWPSLKLPWKEQRGKYEEPGCPTEIELALVSTSGTFAKLKELILHNSIRNFARHSSFLKSTHLFFFLLLLLCVCVCVCVCVFAFSRAAPMAYGGSQARGPIGAVAMGLHLSHSNARSEPCLQPTPQLMATPDS